MNYVALIAVLALSAPLCAQNAGANRISRLEHDAGWQLLFDGVTTAGWRSIKAPGFPAEGWDIDGGALHHTRGGGDLVTERSFGEFELEFEWKVAPGANSGVKYLVGDGDAGAAFGPEYQVLDDERHVDAQDPAHRAAALYDLIPAEGKHLAPVGEFNRARIVARDGRIEHWLNGVRVVNVDTASATFEEAHAQSKYKGSPSFARGHRGRIALQDHGDEVWFRSLRIRELPAASFGELELLPGEGLEGWTEYGDARYTREGRTILGEVGGGGQSFLLSRQAFGDFVFEVDVKTEEPGNSGIQIRCHQNESGRPYGYQIEIDPSPRSWSGGLYDEYRRGWLQDLSKNDAGRESFVYGEWNRFRVECVGPWIRASVNGVPTVDYFDLADVEGVFGLQVHSGNNTRVRWRQPRVWDLGRRSWSAVTAERTPAPCADEDACYALGRVEPSSKALAVRFVLDSPHGGRLHCGDWSLQLAELEGYTTDGTNEIGLCADGQRVVVLLNGRSVQDSLGLPAAGGTVELGLSAALEADALRHVMVLGARAH
jgi:hypothetical protein